MAVRGEQDPRIGTILRGKWTLESLLGVGGMASVYVGAHKIGRRDAVKILRAELASDPVVCERFAREARAANRLRHPGAVEIRDIDVGDDGSPFLVMELLEGESLARRAGRLGGIEEGELLGLTDQLLDVLAAAHAGGIIHRDIKPGNLFVQDDGTLKVLDFGIARIHQEARKTALTRLGDAVGTTAFMAPEQARGDEVDARADLFAVGATMFLMIAKRRIHEADSEAELLTAMATRPAPPLATVAPHASAELCRIVDRALAFDRDARYRDARAMQEDVRVLLRGGGARSAVTLVASDPRDPRASIELLGMRMGGRYQLVEAIGRGGMGAVYEAIDEQGRAYAVKVILSRFADDHPDALRRFAREARATAAVPSPHVVTVVAADTDEATGLPYLVMDRLQGTDLGKLIARHGALDPTAVARIFVQVCAGLAAAHEQGIIHRDIKPANLFLAEQHDGTVNVTILDFGLAKGGEIADGKSSLTQAGGMLGTPVYLSPEQAMDAKHVDARTDLWSLCMSMFEALSGHEPWSECQTNAQIIVALCTQRPPTLARHAPWVDPALAALVARGLERNPARRWHSAAELGRALGAFTGGSDALTAEALAGVRESVRAAASPRDESALPQPEPSRPERARSRGASAATIAFVAVIALGAFILGRVFLWSGASAPAASHDEGEPMFGEKEFQ